MKDSCESCDSWLDYLNTGNFFLNDDCGHVSLMIYYQIIAANSSCFIYLTSGTTIPVLYI